MSDLPLKADIRQRKWHVRYVPITDIQAVVRHDGLFATLKASSWVVLFLRLGSRLAQASLILMVEEAPVGVPLGLLLYLQYASLALFPLAKPLDCDRAQAETSLAGAPHHRRYP